MTCEEFDQITGDTIPCQVSRATRAAIIKHSQDCDKCRESLYADSDKFREDHPLVAAIIDPIRELMQAALKADMQDPEFVATVGGEKVCRPGEGRI